MPSRLVFFAACLLTFGLFATAAFGQPDRVTSGQLVLYGFQEASGTTIQDLSGVAPTLNLTIQNPDHVSWLPGGGLRFNEPTFAISATAATKVIDGVQDSGAITIEAWVLPENTTQDGPARIVTCSGGSAVRNFTLGQGHHEIGSDLYDVRLRTTETSLNGRPSLPTDPGSLDLTITHVLYTRDAAGNAKLYLDGSLAASDVISGSVSNWDDNFKLGIGDELIGDGRPWLGDYYLVAIFDRALSEPEILQNYNAGPGLGPMPPSIITHPQSRTVYEGQTATFTVLAGGTPPLHYEWWRDGAPIAGAPDQPSYLTDPTTLADSGTLFRCRVWNDEDPGGVLSDEALLTVLEFTGAVRIMPCGDSITDDNHSGDVRPEEERIAWRYPLWQLLVNESFNFDFVGSQHNGSAYFPDDDHEGHRGWTDTEIAANIYDWLNLNPADIICLHIGTNGLSSDPAQVEDILENVAQWEVDNGAIVWVLVARIINRSVSASEPVPNYVGSSTLTTTFNNNVEAMVNARITAGDHLMMIDIERDAGIDYRSQPAGDMYDSLHPNDDGYAKMAFMYFEALKALLPPTGLTCPADIQHYWKMEKGIAAYVDQYGTHAGHTDPTDLTQQPAKVVGRVGHAQEFDGSAKHTAGNQLDIEDDDSFDWGPEDSFTLEFWMKKITPPGGTNVNDNEVIVGRDDRDGINLHWWVGVNAGSTPQGLATFQLRDINNNGIDINSSTPLIDGDWHHVAAVRDGPADLNYIYVDGVQEGQVAYDYQAGFGGNAPINVGWLNLSEGFYFDGIVDEIAMYNRALDTFEIAAHHVAGLGGLGYCTTGPVAPTIISEAVTHGYEGEPYSYDVDAVGNPAPTYALLDGPGGMVIDPDSGLLTWDSPAIGNFNVEVEAANSEGTDSQQFTLEISERPVCPPDMFAYLPLDEISGNTYEDIIDGHDGTGSGGVTPTPGQVNGAQNFNGSTAKINISAAAEFDWAYDASFSIEYWMRTPASSTAPGNEVCVGRDHDDTSNSLHWWSGPWDGGDPCFILIATDGSGSGSANYLRGTTDLTNGAWHHVVALRDGTTGHNRIYVDGGLEDQKSVTYTAGFGSASAQINLGWINLSGGYFFQGDLDEVAFYNTALTLAEIQTNYNRGLQGLGYCQEGLVVPLITSTPVTEGFVGQLYEYDVHATGNPVPEYELTQNPPGMSIDPTTGLIQWTPTAIGDFDVTVRAFNSEGEDTQSFTLAVLVLPVCPEGLVSYWQMDDASVPPVLDSFGDNNGICAGGGCPTPASGLVDGALTFDGTEDGVEVADDPSLDFTGSFTATVWINSAQNFSGNKVFIGKFKGSGNAYWWLGGGGNGTVAAFKVGDSNNNSIADLLGFTPINNGAWHQVVGVLDYDNDLVQLYIDGELENTDASVDFTGDFASDDPVNIGYFISAYRYAGSMDEVAVFNRALTAPEIRQQYLNTMQAHHYCEGFAPVILTNAVTDALVGQPYSYDVDAAGHPAPVYSLTDPPGAKAVPPGMTIDPVTGLIEWTPDTPGQFTVVAVATNDQGNDPQEFTITVAEESPFPDCMISYWRLDETAGPPYYDLPGGFHATAINAPTPAVGLLGGAQAFDGSNDEVFAPDADQYEWDGDDDFTIEFWMNSNSQGSVQVMVGRDATDTDLHWWVGALSDNTANFGLRDTGGTYQGTPSTSTIMDGLWHHIVAIRKGSSNLNQIWVDGVMEGETSPTYSGGFTGNATLDIGWLNLNPYFRYNGRVDEVAIYCRALTEAEILTHFNDGQGTEYCEPISPSIVSLPVTDGMVGQLYQYDVEATGCPTPTYDLGAPPPAKIVSAPPGMVIDPITGLITWIPDSEGDFEVTVTATNGAKASVSQTFTVHVEPAPPCPADMIANWQLEEQSGPVYADSFNGHDGTASPAPPTFEAAGVAGGCQDFNGTSNYITVADHADFDWAADASYTIELWANFTNVSSRNKVMIGRDENGGAHWWIGAKQNTGEIWWNHNSTTGGIGILGAPNTNDGAWHHIVAVRDESLDQNRLYLDGGLIAQGTHNYTGSFAAGTTLGIGYMAYHLNPDYYYDGLLDEISLYSRALDEAEIQQHHLNGRNGHGTCGNFAPLIVSAAVTEATLNEPYAYDADAIGNPAPIYALNDPVPVGMVIDPATGLLTWIPTFGGDYPVSIEANNAEGSDTQQFTIHVNLPPVCPDEVVHYYPLDETAGPPFLDRMENSDAECSLCPVAVPGLVGGAQAFNGSNQVDAPDNDTLEWTASSSFSIEFWMYSEGSVAGNRVLVGRDEAGQPLHWWVGALNTGHPFFGLRGSSNVFQGCEGSTVINLGEWHHIVAVRNESNNQNQLWVDGVMENSLTYDYTGDFFGNTELNIGHLNGGYQYEGILDEIAIWNRALTLAEIQEHHEAGLLGYGYCPSAEPPQIISTPFTRARLAEPWTYDVEATGLPDPTFLLLENPAGMTIDGMTGLIEWTPGEIGDFDVTVEAVNEYGNDTQDFTVQVELPPECPDAMLAYWHLDEENGDPFVDFFDGHHGYAIYDDPPTFDPGGVVGGCQVFDGATTSFTVPPHPDLSWPDGESFSIELWLNTTTAKDNEPYVFSWGDLGEYMWLQVLSGGELVWFLNDEFATNLQMYAGTPVNDGDWHHVVLVYDDDTNRVGVHVDGYQDHPDFFWESDGMGHQGEFHFGALRITGGQDLYWNGKLDEVAFFDQALSLAEILEHYEAGLQGNGHCQVAAVPVITSTPVTSAIYGDLYTYDVDATGEPEPTYSLGSTKAAPAGMVIDPQTGVITWLADQTGDFEITVTATNLWGSDEQIYTLTCGHGEYPVIASITDVGNDEGGQVRIIWHRSSHDAQNGSVITGYGIYRRQDEFKALPGAKVAGPAAARRLPGEKIAGWDYIETVPSRGDEIYQYVAPTLVDSTILRGQALSVFMVSAMTPDPLIFFDSAPDSGYSVDNLAPEPPPSFQVVYGDAGNELNWADSPAADLLAYKVFRDTREDFDPREANLVASTRETDWLDDLKGFSGDPLLLYYKVAAQDSSGNIGQARSPETNGGVPGKFALHHNRPNPFNPLTTIAYDLPEPSRVSLRIFDVSGRLIEVLVGGVEETAGRHEVIWNGRDEYGKIVAAGVYFYRLQAGAFDQTRRMMLVK